jgi:hypothetical protein
VGGITHPWKKIKVYSSLDVCPGWVNLVGYSVGNLTCGHLLALRSLRTPRHLHTHRHFVFDRHRQERGQIDFEIGQGTGIVPDIFV